MKLKKHILISFLILLSFVFTTHAESNTYKNSSYPQVEEQIDTVFEKIEKQISNRSVENQIKVYNKIISRIKAMESQNKNLSDKSTFILNHIKYLCTQSIDELNPDEISVDDVLSGIISESTIWDTEIPKIIPGYIDPKERGASELWEFTISWGTITLSELELNIIWDQLFSILKGKVYIIDEKLRKVAENSGHSYYNRESKITFKNQEIKLSPGKYTIWMQAIEVIEDTKIEVEIEDMEVIEEELQDDFGDTYIWAIISKTEILYVDDTREMLKIIPGYIAPKERGASELWEFTISWGNVNIRELELKVRGDEDFSILEGKVYILDSSLKTIAENSGYRYLSKRADVYFNSEKITLIPGKYTIWVEEIIVEEDTNIEIDIEDIKAVENDFEDRYVWTTISETEILYIED